MMDNFVCRAEKARREYNGCGYAQEELLPGADAVNAILPLFPAGRLQRNA